jgi:hypothetical protein
VIVVPPTPHELAVATSVLRTEAGVWDAQAAELAALAPRIEALGFNRLEAGLFQVIVGAHTDLVRHAVARCREGAAEATRIAGTLRAVADTYDAEELAGEHAFRNLY